MKFKWSALQIITVCVALFTLLTFWNYFHQTDKGSLFWIEAGFMVEILVVTAFTRTVSLRFALSLYLQGIVAGLITIIIWNIAHSLGVNTDGAVWSGVLVPLLEEAMKLLPMIIAAVLVYKQRKFLFNLSDMLLLSVMSAGGFSMLEKFFWQGAYFDFTYGPHLGSWYLFSDALGIFVNDQAFGYIGHSAATGFIAMALGLGLYLKFKKTNFSKFWWTVPIIATIWIALEHIFNNMYYINGSQILLTLGGGLVTPWLFLVLLIAVIVIDAMHSMKFVQRYQYAKERLLTSRKALLEKPSFQTIVTLIKHRRVMNLLGWEEVTINDNK